MKHFRNILISVLVCFSTVLFGQNGAMEFSPAFEELVSETAGDIVDPTPVGEMPEGEKDGESDQGNATNKQNSNTAPADSASSAPEMPEANVMSNVKMVNLNSNFNSNGLFSADQDVITEAKTVEIIAMFAFAKDNMIELKWMTASEKDINYFEIEYSADGIVWNYAGQINGAGKNSEDLFYTFNFPVNEKGCGFIRIKKVEMDGSVDINGPIQVANLCPDQNKLTAWVADGTLNINSNIETQLRLHSLDGSQIKMFEIQKGRSQFVLDGLDAGVYVLKSDDSENQKVLVE